MNLPKIFSDSILSNFKRKSKLFNKIFIKNISDS